MNEITKEEGRTIIFISHNMSAIRKLCTRVVYIKNGEVITDGSAEKTISKYQHQYINGKAYWINKEFSPKKKLFDISSVRILSQNKKRQNQFINTKNIFIEINIEVDKEDDKEILFLEIHKSEVLVFSTPFMLNYDSKTKRGNHKLICTIPEHLLSKGKYSVSLKGSLYCVRPLFEYDHILSLDIELMPEKGLHMKGHHGVTYPNLKWQKIR